MTGPRPLPSLMVAPNGARRGKADHPALPVTLDEVIETAIACVDAGADGLHLHVRDKDGAHSLDAGLYREAFAALSEAQPDLFVQATSEAAGQYSAEEQRAMVRELRPASVSVALREMIRNTQDTSDARAFYHWAADNGVAIQHIAYTPEELGWLLRVIDDGVIPGDAHQLQLVLGAYGDTGPPPSGMLDAYLELLRSRKGVLRFDWMVCAFGPSETACLAEVVRNGGKARVGFENSLWNADGSVARDNAERVAEVKAAIDADAASGAARNGCAAQ